ncbi:MAG: hypothetical protein IK084_03020 [Bacteroidaceae bacterium]|nr:hypothetical protein [Bacteroidaceae bacterium]
MKKYIFASALVLLSAVATAQDTYSNFTMTNTSDVFGTARYVGMGGAMGALGADISAMSNNPASLGLFRKNDISLTMGGIIQDAKPYSTDSRGRYSFDQVGFVASFPNYDGSSFLNFALNLQKKANYGHSLFVQDQNLNGLSQAAQLKGLFYNGLQYSGNENFQYSLPYEATNAYIFDLEIAGESGYHPIKSRAYEFNRYSSGQLYGLDLGLAGSIQDRVYLGFDFGFDFLKYENTQRYLESRDGSRGEVEDYDILSNKYVSGTGINLKFGALVRPIDENPLRIGFAFETPTWYVLTQKRSYFSIASKWESHYDEIKDFYNYTYNPDGVYTTYDSRDDNFLDFNIHSPWKVRASIASTVDKFLAWDVEYEYALYNNATIGYPRNYTNSGASMSMHKDPGMTALTKQNINGIHNIRAGLEFKALPEFSIRLGYNFWSKPMKDGARLDQTVDSKAVDFLLGTDYINLGATNMLSFGLGYRYKAFYADFAYKYRAQKGDFYAFDDTFQRTGSAADYGQFMASGQSLRPTEVDFSRHTIAFTLGFKF